MKGKTYTAENKICILREVDWGGKSIQTVCQEQNISEVNAVAGWQNLLQRRPVNLPLAKDLPLADVLDGHLASYVGPLTHLCVLTSRFRICPATLLPDRVRKQVSVGVPQF